MTAPVCNCPCHPEPVEMRLPPDRVPYCPICHDRGWSECFAAIDRLTERTQPLDRNSDVCVVGAVVALKARLDELLDMRHSSHSKDCECACFERGLAATLTIRCRNHYATPQQNSTASGAECGGCIADDFRAYRETADEVEKSLRARIAALEARADAAEAEAAQWKSKAIGQEDYSGEVIALRAEVERLTRERDEAREEMAIKTRYVEGWMQRYAESRRLLERAQTTLRALMDVQNGPPLLAWEQAWSDAMAASISVELEIRTHLAGGE